MPVSAPVVLFVAIVSRLVLVHALVRFVELGLDVLVGAAPGNADRNADVVMGHLIEDRSHGRFESFLAKLGVDDDELVTADAIGPSFETTVDMAGDLADEVVACCVSVLVIHGLQAVHVEVRNAQMWSLPVVAILEALTEFAAVVKASQLILEAFLT